jgi:hypothetical protein
VDRIQSFNICWVVHKFVQNEKEKKKTVMVPVPRASDSGGDSADSGDSGGEVVTVTMARGGEVPVTDVTVVTVVKVMKVVATVVVVTVAAVVVSDFRKIRHFWEEAISLQKDTFLREQGVEREACDQSFHRQFSEANAKSTLTRKAQINFQLQFSQNEYFSEEIEANVSASSRGKCAANTWRKLTRLNSFSKQTTIVLGDGICFAI